MYQPTPQELSFRESLPPGLRDLAQAEMNYSGYFRLANHHLQEFYGPRADLNQCIEQYRGSEEYLLRVNRFLKLVGGKEGDSPAGARPGGRSRIMQAAGMLGILPECEQDSLYRYMIDRRGLSNEEKQQIEVRMEQNPNLVEAAVNSMAKTFEPGLLLTFPLIGTVMTQQKCRYFYRGENAYYGYSNPGLYRKRGGRAGNDLDHWIGWLKINEACCFLDEFEAVRKWTACAVNYLALAQHYGIPTMMMDITSDLQTALFFACCKYGKDRKWHPLEKIDFAQRTSRKQVADLGGDSRYGILYRSLTEFTDVKWALSDDGVGANLITPVGYQPFMRCSSQHGYMLLAANPEYDMQKDAAFAKYRFRLDEDLCRWIYEKMDCGDKIYPHQDIPNLEQYMEKIKRSGQVSRQAFELTVKTFALTDEQSVRCRREITRRGLTIVDGKIEHITANQLRKINKRYGIDTALKRMDECPRLSPRIHL